MNIIPKRRPSFIISKRRSCIIPKMTVLPKSFENEGAVINLHRKSMINLYMISFLNDGHIFSYANDGHRASGFEKEGHLKMKLARRSHYD